jgi:hypothetical protein
LRIKICMNKPFKPTQSHSEPPKLQASQLGLPLPHKHPHLRRPQPSHQQKTPKSIHHTDPQHYQRIEKVRLPHPRITPTHLQLLKAHKHNILHISLQHPHPNNTPSTVLPHPHAWNPHQQQTPLQQVHHKQQDNGIQEVDEDIMSVGVEVHLAALLQPKLLRSVSTVLLLRSNKCELFKGSCESAQELRCQFSIIQNMHNMKHMSSRRRVQSIMIPIQPKMIQQHIQRCQTSP